MSFFSDHVTDNPMLVEIRRWKRRLLSSRGGGTSIASIVLGIVFYLIILAAVASGSANVEPLWLIFIQGLLFVLLIPVMVSGTIAGERERRTWEILLVAPITKSQIVAGKFIAGFYTTCIFALFMIPPVLICSIMYKDAMLRYTLLAEFYTMMLAVLLVAGSVWLSSRCRTTYLALGACLGSMFTLFVALPLFVSAMMQFGTAKSYDGLDTWYPMSILIRLADRDFLSRPYNPVDVVAWNSVAYFLVAAMLLIAAGRSIAKSDQAANLYPEKAGGRKARNA